MSSYCFLQVILGIVFPPSILLMDFRLGEEATYNSSKEKEEGKDRDDDNKSNKVHNNYYSMKSF